MARLNHGAYRRRLLLSGRPCRSWRDAEAREKTCSDKFPGGNSVDRASQYRFETAWIAYASRATQRFGNRGALPLHSQVHFFRFHSGLLYWKVVILAALAEKLGTQF